MRTVRLPEVERVDHMENASDTGAPQASPSVAVGDPFYDPLLFDWTVIAAVAWEGYLTQGEGHVAIVVADEVMFLYRPGAPCECHGDAVREYDPEAQVVVAVYMDETSRVECLTGWPPPPRAWATVGAEAVGAPLQ